MALNKIMFVSYDDDGKTTWKCLCCNQRMDAGSPSYSYLDDSTSPGIVTGCYYSFCPYCGTKFEGIQQNTKFESKKYHPFDVKERMEYRYKQLKWILEDRQRYRRERIEYFYKYRERVAEFLDELDEYTCDATNFCRPRIENRYR